MKVLNLYAGIGGNRKLWPNDEIEVWAVEIDPEIARIYQDFFPNDKVIVADAHKFLIEHYKEFDFIWSSPPCVSHSQLRFMASKGGDYPPIYPDMRLYQEIVFLRGFFQGPWVVENVRGYYEPMIPPFEIGRHYYWANFVIPKKEIAGEPQDIHSITGASPLYGFDLSSYKISKRKDQVIRNLVNPEMGLYIFRCAFKDKQTRLWP